MGLKGECIDETIIVNPLQPSLYVFRDFTNEVGAFRVLANFAGLKYEEQVTLHLANKYLDCTIGPENISLIFWNN